VLLAATRLRLEIPGESGKSAAETAAGRPKSDPATADKSQAERDAGATDVGADRTGNHDLRASKTGTERTCSFIPTL
jgi:hypothetical protein